MSLGNCCGYSINELNESFYFQRDSSEVWSRICGAISLICLIAFVIFGVMNLINNPNYSLFTGTITPSQISFVIGTLTIGIVFGIASMFLHARYRSYDSLIQQYLFTQIHKEKKAPTFL